MEAMTVLWIVAAAVGFVLVVSLLEYRKRLKELELSSRFDELERSMHIRFEGVERRMDDSSREMWHEFERVHDRFADCPAECQEAPEECCVQAAPRRRR